MIKAVLFDFDGVILDSYHPIIYAYQDILKRFGKIPPKTNKFITLLGLPAIDIFRKLAKEDDEKTINKMFEHLVAYSPIIEKQIVLFDGAKKMLSQLHTGYKLAVVSNRRHVTLQRLIDKFSLRTFFKTIVAKDDAINPKPHPELLEKAIENLNVSKNESIYVGDMREDILAAKNADIPFIYFKNEWNQPYNGQYSITSLMQLPQFLLNIV